MVYEGMANDSGVERGIEEGAVEADVGKWWRKIVELGDRGLGEAELLPFECR